MEKKRQIMVTLQVEGLHKWKEAETVCPKSAFLSRSHRHIFHIKAIKRVNHNERDVEFLEFKRRIESFIMNEYPRYRNDIRVVNFGKRSCETIAEELLNQFGLDLCEVSEDNECGSIISI